MSSQNRIAQLSNSLRAEITAARPGSHEGQLPILDLLGNLRDEAAGKPGWARLHTLCVGAWERVLAIVESGQAFQTEEVQWLNELPGRIQSLIQPGHASTAKPAQGKAAVPATATVGPPGEEEPINLKIGDDGDLLREFITESREHLDHIEQGVLVLENQPADAETLNTIFRAFHTFKGGAGFLNLIPINRLAHVLESLLDLARQGKLAMAAPVMELILRGCDVLKQFLDDIEGQLAGTRPVAPILIPTAALRAEAQKMIDDTCSGAARGAPAPEAEAPAAPPSTNGAEAAPDVKTAGLAALVKVHTGKLDSLLELVGEMVIAQSLVSQDLSQLTDLNPQFARNTAQLGRLTKELQRVSMSLRMVPIRGVFQKMARVVRDLSAKQQKKVQLLTSGEDTELDRGVVEQLNDPLLHMIRNAMDHGLEPAGRRMAAGKPPVGTLQLRAYHQGGNIVLEIKDDGAGLNRERIQQKAIERGLISAGADVTDEDVSSFIFAAGFSTAENVTDLSGRGVGLDVVRRNIDRLGGRVDVSSRPGLGTLFKITLPLTLAIIDGLIVKVGEERYIIPTLSVRESFRPQANMVTQVQNRAEVVNVRGRLIPVLRLRELFGIKSSPRNLTDGIIVVAQSGTALRCLWVDDLLRKQEVVIKNLNDMMVHKNRALAGAAILSDGQVGLILDVNALVHLGTQTASFN